MVTAEDREHARKAELMYESKLRATLEETHHGQYVALFPEFGTHYVGRTLETASAAGRHAHPGFLPYVRRIGFPFVFELGYCA